jgi:hypothetical protein
MAAAWRVLAGVGPEGMHIDDVSAVCGDVFCAVCAKLWCAEDTWMAAAWLALVGVVGPEGMHIDNVRGDQG